MKVIDNTQLKSPDGRPAVIALDNTGRNTINFTPLLVIKAALREAVITAENGGHAIADKVYDLSVRFATQKTEPKKIELDQNEYLAVRIALSVTSGLFAAIYESQARARVNDAEDKVEKKAPGKRAVKARK